MPRKAIGLIGWGTVGGGVVEILQRDHALFAERCGLDLALTHVVTRNPGRDRSCGPGAALPAEVRVSDRPDALLADPEVQVVIHLVGGTGVAKDLLLACLRAGKHVVTANKALLAEHGDELFAEARRHEVAIAFEAAVAGGIPVIAAVRDGLVANRIERICGILNGTCNYILTQMESEHWDYGHALAEAQRLGYAELDPTLDVNGTDTAHKAAILARIAQAARIPFADVTVEGIDALTAEDIASAARMGCRIKLLGVVQRQSDGLVVRVGPTLVPMDHPLAVVRKNFNGIAITGSATGQIILTGAGAGALPTASAILSDVIDVLSGSYQATTGLFRFFTGESVASILPPTEEVTGAYARFRVRDQTGVLAGIAGTLSRHGVGILSVHQGLPVNGEVAIEMTTHPLRLGALRTAIADIDGSGLTVSKTIVLRRL